MADSTVADNIQALIDHLKRQIAQHPFPHLEAQLREQEAQLAYVKKRGVK